MCSRPTFIAVQGAHTRYGPSLDRLWGIEVERVQSGAAETLAATVKLDTQADGFRSEVRERCPAAPGSPNGDTRRSDRVGLGQGITRNRLAIEIEKLDLGIASVSVHVVDVESDLFTVSVSEMNGHGDEPTGPGSAMGGVTPADVDALESEPIATEDCTSSPVL